MHDPDRSTDLSVRVRQRLGCSQRPITFIEPARKQDYASRGGLVAALEHLDGHVILDLSSTFVDDSLIGAIRSKAQALGKAGYRLELVVPRTAPFARVWDLESGRSTRTTAIPLRRRTWYVKARGRRWAVQRQDAGSADSVHDTKEAAIARGVELGQRAQGCLRIKGLDGRVESEHTFLGLPSVHELKQPRADRASGNPGPQRCPVEILTPLTPSHARP
jgi:hypothetical protein